MIRIFLFCIALLTFTNAFADKIYHYYSTVADEKHYPFLLNLIGSIHHTDFEQLDQIAVFDLGLTEAQRGSLEKIEKVHVYAIENVNPDLKTYFQTSSFKQVRGWYAWKPVVLKQSLDMFPYFLYIDSATIVVKPLDPVFKHIAQNGYLLFEAPPHCIVDRLTKPPKEKIVDKLPQEKQQLVLNKNTYMIVGGVQGIGGKVREDYIIPMYSLASDLTLFADDGSAPLGFGSGRHDQTLFSIYARVLGLKVNAEGFSDLIVDGKPVPFHYHWDPKAINDLTGIYSCRTDQNECTNKSQFIRWKK